MQTRFQRCAVRIALIAPFAVFFNSPPAALSSPILGAAQTFAVLGNSTVTNTGPTTITGDLGLSPGTSITGLTSIVLTGTVDDTNAAAQQAQNSLGTAYSTLAALPSTENLTGDDLGTLGTLTPGVYSFMSSAQLTGTVTLNAENNPNALFVFEIGSTLTTASNSTVDVINGTPGTGVFWLVGSSATLGTGTSFAGNILANTSITLTTGATIQCGRALALTGAVTLDNNTISDACSAGANSDFGSAGFSGINTVTAPVTTPAATPEPGTVLLLSAGLIAFVFRQMRRRSDVIRSQGAI